MRGSSAESYARLEESLATPSTQAGEELIAAARLLRDQTALRRAATDTASPEAVRRELLTNVFGPHLGDAAAVLARAGELRWATSIDLPHALERLGVATIVRAADSEGDGDRVETELFGFGRLVETNTEVREALADPARSVEDKQSLIEGLLGGATAPATVRLARESVTGNWRSVQVAIDDLIEIAASARGRKVATVRSAYPISEAQQTRLAELLGRDAGTKVNLNVIVDPALVGGVRVEIGDDVIDGTVGSRLDDVRRRLAG